MRKQNKSIFKSLQQVLWSFFIGLLLVPNLNAQIAKEYFKGILFSTPSKDIKTRKYYDNTAVHKIKSLNIDNKEVLTFLVKYYGSEAYFSEIKRQIDSLRNLNYTIVYGGDSVIGYNTKIARDTNDFKIRKCYCEYLNPIQNQVEKKHHKYLLEKKELVFYNKQMFGIKEEGISLDISKSDFVQRFETKNGEITLSNKDIKTKEKSKYKCKEKDTKRYLYVMQAAYILEQIKDLKSDKIVLVLSDKLWFPFFVYGTKEHNLKIKKGFVYEYYFEEQ